MFCLETIFLDCARLARLSIEVIMKRRYALSFFFGMTVEILLRHFFSLGGAVILFVHIKIISSSSRLPIILLSVFFFFFSKANR